MGGVRGRSLREKFEGEVGDGRCGFEICEGFLGEWKSIREFSLFLRSSFGTPTISKCE